MKTYKTHISKIAVIAFLAMALIAPISPANADLIVINDGAVNVALQGQIEAATIDILIDKASLELDIDAGDVQATDTVTITSKAVIPVKMTLASVSHKEEGWSPTMIATDPVNLTWQDAQSKARLTITTDTTDTNYLVAPTASIVPLGTGSTLDGSLTYPVALGTIDETNGTDGKSVEVTGTLDVSKKRLVTKTLNSQMGLNFAAAEFNPNP